MQFREVLRRQLSYLPIAQAYSRLSKTEERILTIMITLKSGNAYNSWKASGLKHYPTVLRTLKKLEEKRLVQVMSENGIRGERIYVPTLFGTLLHFALKDEITRLKEIISQNSTLFRELLESLGTGDSLHYAYMVVREMVSDVAGGKSRTIDNILKEYFDLVIINEVTNIHLGGGEKHKNEVIKLTKVEWLRKLTIEIIEAEIKSSEKLIQELKKLKQTFTT